MQATAMIQRCQHLLQDPDGQFHSDDRMLEHLNASMEEISDRTRYLHVASYLALEEGRAWYSLPPNFLSTDLVVMRGMSYPLSHTPFAQVLPWLFAGSSKGIPQCYDIFGNGADERFWATIANADGQVMSFADVYQGQTFRAGDIIVNIDNANAVAELYDGLRLPNGDITAEEADYRNVVGGIPGRNAFVSGDTVRVLSPNSSLKTIVLSPTPDTTDSDGEESLFVFAAMRPRTITKTDIELGNAELELDVELETPLRHLIMFYARMSELGEEAPATQMSKNYFETSLFKVAGKIKRRVRDWKSGYLNRFSQGWFRDRRIVDNTIGAGQDYALSRIDV